MSNRAAKEAYDAICAAQLAVMTAHHRTRESGSVAMNLTSAAWDLLEEALEVLDGEAQPEATTGGGADDGGPER